MVGISLLDKKLKTENIIDTESGNKLVGIGIRLVALALMAGIIASFFVYPLRHLALEAIYVPVVAFILIGLILILNNKLAKMDMKAIIIKKGLFRTSATFNFASIGICGILAALYYFFW
jgi:hypothetical protein